MQNRRRFLAGLAGLGAGAAMPARAASPHGAIDATQLGLRPGLRTDQSRAFSLALEAAADRNAPVHLPAGDYIVSGITLPRRVLLSGVPGATRIIHGGDGHFLLAETADHIDLSGLVIDGANRWLGDHARAAVDMRGVRRLAIDNCSVLASGGNAIALERVAGSIERTLVSGAADAGIYSVEGLGLHITGNTVADCGNGGILVHRWQPGDDGTIVSGNRVERIAARDGGTGQFGNGINVYRADGVMIANNVVADCAFSAIRSNSGGNVQITGNTCLRSGETAIYSEFAFEGAVIASNVVDGAANGISIVNFNEGGRLAVCSGNLVRNLSSTGPYPADPPGFGIGIVVEADTAVTGNVVENAPLYGLQIGWGPFMRNVTATGNVVRRAATGIAVSVVEGAGSAVISGNVIGDAPNGAIVGHRWARPVTGDLARSTADAPPHLVVFGNAAS